MYSIESREHADKIFCKMEKKNRKQLEIIQKKLAQISINPHMFKSLRAPLNDLRRVHIDKSFVLVYSIDEKRKIIIIEDYDHHDNIYKKRLYR